MEDLPLKFGSTGDSVMWVQRRLKALGYFKEGVTCLYCEATGKAVSAFQTDNGLFVDGEVNGEVWERLKSASEDKAYSFEDVLGIELCDIDRSRRARLDDSRHLTREEDTITRAHQARLMGLAFSGGGIRSATFNLGVLQALVELNLLRLIDYLSTVSGGGYIGSWLTAWIHRQSLKEVEAGLAPNPDDGPKGGLGSASPPGGNREPHALEFLRSYSNYITPKTGPFSADSWSVVSTYTRNLVLNLIVIVSVLCTLLLFPLLLAFGFWGGGKTCSLLLVLLPVSTLFLLLIGSIFITTNLRQLTRGSVCEPHDREEVEEHPFYTHQWAVLIGVVLPAVLAAVFFSIFIWSCSQWSCSHWSCSHWNCSHWNCSRWFETYSLRESWLSWMGGGAGGYVGLWVGGWLIGALIERMLVKREDKTPGEEGNAPPPEGGGKIRHLVWNIPAGFLAGAAGGLLLPILADLLNRGGGDSSHLRQLSLVLSFGPPCVILLFSFVVTLHIGLLGRLSPGRVHEWWSRLGAWLLIVALVWTFWFSIAFYGPALMRWMGKWGQYAFASGWLVSTIGGLWAGRSASTGVAGKVSPADAAALVTPYAFAIGLFLLLSVLIDAILRNVLIGSVPVPNGRPVCLDALSCYMDFGSGDGSFFLKLCGLFSLCLVIATVFAWRVDINFFSMHLFYRNRLVRCYLGATNDNRNPQPFMGFDACDDMPLSQLASPKCTGGNSALSGPYPIINATLNLVAGENLAWQERKAASFVFTPGYCGYEFFLCDAEEKEKASAPCYRDTSVYADPEKKGISLGTAMAISGAAASPNMGYHSSPPLAFLMTVFNIRLGWWLGNPRGAGLLHRLFPQALRPTWKKAGPGFGLYYLLSELFGFSTEKSSYVYLSDGGHFENLGLYELVRRRCRYIIACDGAQDEKYAFEDLGNAIRKCYTDFGIEIEMNVGQIRPQGERELSPWHCAVGTIHYERIDKDATPGTLVYVKASLTGDEPTDVLSYRAKNPIFPQQSTADQWFDESQFESYRKLGHHIGKAVFGPAVEAVLESKRKGSRAYAGKSDSIPEPEALFRRLRQYWYPPSQAGSGSFSRHGKALEEMMERLRKDQNLRFLDAQIYPEWEALVGQAKVQIPETIWWLPETEAELRAGFYFCNSMIQLMENVYHDLQFEEEFDHPDNRGWMNLFKHWSWSGMFRATWAISAATYGIRFQSFCSRHLDLTVGEIRVEGEHLESSTFEELVDRACEKGHLNFLEADLLRLFHKEHKHSFSNPSLWVLRIVVRDPMEGGCEPKAEEDRWLNFPFGFALLDGENRIMFLRVRDHLRRMGLARKGLSELMKVHEGLGKPLGIALKPMPENACEVPKESDYRRFKRLFVSVRNERCPSGSMSEGGRKA